MSRCAGQSTTEFMLMVVLLAGMAIVVRRHIWPALPMLHMQVVGHVAADGKLINSSP